MITRSPDRAPRPRHPWLYALPGAVLPPTVDCAGGRYRLVQTFKHDFFAATGLYHGPGGLAVGKFGRTTPFLGLPMAWIGHFLTGREVGLYERARGVAGVPDLIGRVAPCGFLHAYVPGHALQRGERVGDAFFDELVAALAALHTRHIAYVDLNKRENILVGDDGRPHLIDFQIALCLPPRGLARLPPVQWLLRRFQRADAYHALKHKRRSRPDLLTSEECDRLARLSPGIRVHRLLFRPLIQVRRRILQRLHRGGPDSVPGSAAK